MERGSYSWAPVAAPRQTSTTTEVRDTSGHGPGAVGVDVPLSRSPTRPVGVVGVVRTSDRRDGVPLHRASSLLPASDLSVPVGPIPGSTDPLHTYPKGSVANNRCPLGTRLDTPSVSGPSGVGS